MTGRGAEALREGLKAVQGEEYHKMVTEVITQFDEQEPGVLFLPRTRDARFQAELTRIRKNLVGKTVWQP